MTNELPVLSVTDVSLSLKSCVEQVFSDIRVRGEIAGVKRATSGHIYFSLKDTDAVLSAICWRGKSKQVTDLIQEGLEVIARGKLSTYPGRSSYQMIVESVEPAGEGALLKLLKERREKLEKEGLFDATRKKKLPFLPKTIGVVTSPTGAVIRDIIHRLTDRFPVRVLLWPVLVQGEGAADQITNAIQGFNTIPTNGLQTSDGVIPRPDLLIVARGGGSLEDLWCFNEENVVRATANSQIPIISAVGHETDTTLIDYTSDLRAPTPTGAAELAVPVRSDLMIQTERYKTRLTESVYRLIEELRQKLSLYIRGMPKLGELLNVFLEKLDDRTERLKNAITVYYESYQTKLTALSRLLKSYSYTDILERGFSLIFDSKKQVISSKQVAEKQSKLDILFADGSLSVTPKKTSVKPTKSEPIHTDQLGLFDEK